MPALACSNSASISALGFSVRREATTMAMEERMKAGSSDKIEAKRTEVLSEIEDIHLAIKQM